MAKVAAKMANVQVCANIVILCALCQVGCSDVSDLGLSAAWDGRLAGKTGNRRRRQPDGGFGLARLSCGQHAARTSFVVRWELIDILSLEKNGSPGSDRTQPYS